MHWVHRDRLEIRELPVQLAQLVKLVQLDLTEVWDRLDPPDLLAKLVQLDLTDLLVLLVQPAIRETLVQ